MAAFPWAEEGQMMDSHHYTIKQRQQHLINRQERLSAYNILLLIVEKRFPNLSSPPFKMDPNCLWKKLKKIIILILSVVSKKYHYSAHGGTLEIPRGMRVFKAKILKWKNCFLKGKLYCLWGEWVFVVGEGVG